jgi:hypothetical protein
MTIKNKYLRMKKQITFLAMLAIIAQSCGKEKATAEFTPPISGTWKISKIAKISGKDGNILSSITMTNCNVNNSYTFNKDSSVVVSTYSGSNCDNITNTNGTYDYANNPNTNKLSIKMAGSATTDVYIVQKLNELELQYYSINQIDYNNDGVLDKEVVYLHR